MVKLVDVEALFTGRHFDREVIILCLRRYLRFKLSFRDLVEMMGVNAGKKMHRRAGAKIHQGRTPEGPRGGLLALRLDSAAKGVAAACRDEAQGSWAGAQSLPKPRGGSIAWSSARSRSQITCSAAASALSCRLAGSASSQAA